MQKMKHKCLFSRIMHAFLNASKKLLLKPLLDGIHNFIREKYKMVISIIPKYQ